MTFFKSLFTFFCSYHLISPAVIKKSKWLHASHLTHTCLFTTMFYLPLCRCYNSLFENSYKKLKTKYVFLHAVSASEIRSEENKQTSIQALSLTSLLMLLNLIQSYHIQRDVVISIFV